MMHGRTNIKVKILLNISGFNVYLDMACRLNEKSIICVKFSPYKVFFSVIFSPLNPIETIRWGFTVLSTSYLMCSLAYRIQRT